MKYLITALISIFAFNANLLSQNSIDKVLTMVEQNNTSLLAMRKGVDADKIGNKTGIYLENPEFEFHYLWGKPSELGKRKDFSITQSFDFPSAYKFKNQISDIRNEQVELEYQKQRLTLLFETRSICIDMVYQNALKAEISKRLSHAQSIAKSYKSKFDSGEANILEYNKAQLNALNLGKELELIEIERDVLLGELAEMNGGKKVDLVDSVFQTAVVPVDFEQWYVQAEQNNPLLNWLRHEIDLSQKDEKLQKAMSLPKLHAGYMSEKILDETLQGITVGLSIPLWENKNTVKYARANTAAMQSRAHDSKLRVYNHLKTLHSKAVSLQKSAGDYRSSLQLYSNADLYQLALDKGEISLIEYILEFAIYYESFNKLLELEREMHLTIAELNQYL